MKNKKLAIKVIKGDCQIRSHYINQKGQTCAVGALAIAAGFKFPKWDESWTYGFEGNSTIINLAESGVVLKMASAIKKRFGLSVEKLGYIQEANDAMDTPTERRVAILKILKAIPED